MSFKANPLVDEALQETKPQNKKSLSDTMFVGAFIACMLLMIYTILLVAHHTIGILFLLQGILITLMICYVLGKLAGRFNLK